MRTDLNVWLNDTNQTIQQLPFYFANNSSGINEGNLSLPPLEVTGLDQVISFQIVQTVILMFILYYTWRTWRLR
jgi:hypothetical protein